MKTTYEVPVPSQYIYRVESRFLTRRVFPNPHNITEWIDLGFGPYVLANNWIPLARVSLAETLRKNEPCQILNYDYSKVEKNGYPLPAFWSQPRSGPFEDPYLRDWFMALKMEEKLNLTYGFRTKNQIFDWFFDIESVNALINYQFDVHQYRSKHIIHGLRQSVLDISKPFNRVRVYTLNEIIKEIF